MNCQDAKTLLHAHVDGELDAVRTQEVEQHLHTCATCAVTMKNAHALKTAIHRAALGFSAPSHVRSGVLAAVAATLPVAHTALPWWKGWKFLTGASATSVAVVAATMFAATRPTENEKLLQEIAVSHVRSLVTRHLTDVTATDSAAMQPLFAGKLDFGPVAPDLSGLGYRLLGARMDYFKDRPAAAFVYQKDQHLVNVFVWQMTCEDEVPNKQASLQGLNVSEWSQGGVGYAAVSDVSAEEMKSLTAAARK